MLQNLTLISEQSWRFDLIERAIIYNVILSGIQTGRKGAIESKECWIHHPLVCRSALMAPDQHHDVLTVWASIA